MALVLQIELLLTGLAGWCPVYWACRVRSTRSRALVHITHHFRYRPRLFRNVERYEVTVGNHVNLCSAQLTNTQQEVPAPHRADTGRYLLGAMMAPLWNDGTRWQTITPFPERRPVFGFYDEGTPEVTDWEIKWALDNGISFFMPCWFRAAGNLGKSPVEPVLDHWIQGLASSRYADRIEFAILWENRNAIACGVASEEDLLGNLMPFWIKQYFKDSRYLLDHGNPSWRSSIPRSS